METNKRKALGKGLEQLFNSEPMNFDSFEQEIVETTKDKDIMEINIDDIRPNPYQPREHFDEEGLMELANSIKEHGIIEPIIVKKSVKGYELVAGERRTRASKIAGLTKIPAIIKDFTDQEMMDIAILENIQREDLSPVELAQGFQKYIDNTGLTQDEIATKFGKSRSYITNLLGLLKLPMLVREQINSKLISQSHARVLSKLDDDDLIIALAQRCVNEDLSVRDLEKLCSMESIVKRKPINRVKIRPIVYNSYENIMRDKLGCKVQISKNKISIPFDSDGDLSRIFEILNIDVDDE